MKYMVAALSLLAGLSLLPGPAAHEGHSHRVMGFVKAVDAAHIEIETKEGTKVSAILNEETKYHRGKAAATAADVKAGNRVVLTFVEKEGKKIAQEVLLAPRKVSTPHRSMRQGNLDRLPSAISFVRSTFARILVRTKRTC